MIETSEHHAQKKAFLQSKSQIFQIIFMHCQRRHDSSPSLLWQSHKRNENETLKAFANVTGPLNIGLNHAFFDVWRNNCASSDNENNGTSDNSSTSPNFKSNWIKKNAVAFPVINTLKITNTKKQKPWKIRLKLREIMEEFAFLSDPWFLAYFTLGIVILWLLLRCLSLSSGADLGRFSSTSTHHWTAGN